MATDASTPGLLEASRVLRAPVTPRHPLEGWQVAGTWDGTPILYLEGRGQSVIIATFPAKLDDLLLEIHVGNEYLEELARAGKYLDVVTGDPELDRLCVIEGAPADAVREALDERTRRWLCKRGAGTLQIRNGLEAHFQADRLAGPAVVEAIEVIAGFAAGLPGAIRRAAHARDGRPDGAGTPYRPGHDRAAAEQRHAEARREIEDLRRRQDARLRWVPVFLVSVLLGIAGAIYLVVTR